MANDMDFMEVAFGEALAGLREGGLPIGSVLVRAGDVVGRGRNRRVQKSDPVAHAEIECLRDAGRIGDYLGCTLYSTLMPCYLCAGAIVQFGIQDLVVGEARNFGGAENLLRDKGVRVSTVDDARCIELMARFIRESPELWNEDIGGRERR